MDKGNPQLTFPRKVEEAILWQLKQQAMSTCKMQASAYAACCTGRSLSIVWACRSQLADLNTCLHAHTNSEVLGVVKTRWLDAGCPERPDWKDLLRDL